MDLVTAASVLGLILTAAGVYFGWRQVQIAHSGRGKREATPEATPDTNHTGLERAPDIFASVRAKGVLRVGCLWYPPFVEFAEQGEKVAAKGLYPTMIECIAAQSVLHVEYQILRWDTASEAVNR